MNLRRPADPTPMYFTLKNVLLSRIRALELPPGSRLPAERQLAVDYRISRITVRQALEALEREGLIRRERGRQGGTFVCADAPPDARLSGSFEALFAQGRIRRIEVRALEERRGNAEICAALHLPPDSPVTYLEQRFTGAGGPVGHVRTFLPVAVGAGLRRRDLRRRPLQDLLLATPGVKVADMHDEIEATLADSVAAALLEVGVGRPLLRVRRTLLAPGDQPIYVAIVLIVSERYTVTRHERQR